ncbi:phosphonate ABC transporter, permease protein PhnE [Spirillospora sp. NPDC029432]|uniref:phosphonate ABC transporter, permease protein PhnE n=1 Tax=Spirillospora sp. NPDC029432 TaxID=3154599 RepID=UPI0034523003
MTALSPARTPSGPPGAARPSTRPPLTARRAVAWLFPLAFCGLGLAAVGHTRLNLATLADGLGAAAGLLARSWPPTIGDPAATAVHVLDSLWMAVAGTALAAAAAAVLAVGAARNTAPARPVRAVALGIIVACRAVPDVVFAVFFLAALGIGPLVGVLALGLHSVGMLGRLFTEAVERCDEGVREAVAGTGAGPAQRLLTGVLPQAAPSMVAATLFRLDINFRGSVLLGAVGAGGIGLDLKTAFGFTDYREATGIALVIVAVVLAVEAASMGLRRALLGGGGTARSVPPVRGTRAPWTGGRRAVHLAGWGGLVIVAVACARTGLTPGAPAELVPRLADAAGRFLPPRFEPIAGSLAPGLVETCAIAMTATFLGVIAGAPLGLLAARTVVSNPVPRLLSRAVLVGLRSIPDLLLVLVFVAALGVALGAVAGSCALAVFTAALVAKLTADAAEEMRPGPREALDSAGASRTAELAVSVPGQLTPGLVGTVLYALDHNLRAFFVLGIVGAGELGFALSQNIRTLNFDVVTAIVLPVFAVVLAVELVSTAVRDALR